MKITAVKGKKLRKPSQYALRKRTQYNQGWINGVVDGLVAWLPCLEGPMHNIVVYIYIVLWFIFSASSYVTCVLCKL